MQLSRYPNLLGTLAVHASHDRIHRYYGTIHPSYGPMHPSYGMMHASYDVVLMLLIYNRNFIPQICHFFYLITSTENNCQLQSKAIPFDSVRKPHSRQYPCRRSRAC